MMPLKRSPLFFEMSADIFIRYGLLFLGNALFFFALKSTVYKRVDVKSQT